MRVRFAPSPTGYLHIGGARTALYCHLIARSRKGVLLLRVEDSDLERSQKKFEEAMIDDLRWLGIDFQEGPHRQSDRLALYRSLANELVEKNQAYPCFLKENELALLKDQALAEKRPPHHYFDKYRNLSREAASEKIAAGEPYAIRFKNPGREYRFTDLVRGEVSFPKDMVGDFVIMRQNGMPVYNFCCPIDDWKMDISLVLRGEEHINNTVRQLMIFDAFGAKAPQFAHCSILVNKERRKLSKREGATSVYQYREEGYLPAALANYLCLLGWTHPEEREFLSMEEIVACFDVAHLNKAPAFYDIDKLKFLNNLHLKALDEQQLLNFVKDFIPSEHPFHAEKKEWQERAVGAFVTRLNLPGEVIPHLDSLFKEDKSPLEEEHLIMRDYLFSELNLLQTAGKIYPAMEDVAAWIQHIKKELKIKGAALFKGVRFILTGEKEGIDLKTLISLTKIEVLLKRIS